MVLGVRYAMSGTEKQYAATSRREPDGLHLRERVLAPGWKARYLKSSFTSSCYAVSGTDVAYGATRIRVYRVPIRSDMRGGWAIVLRACYAMSSTDVAYGVIGLRARYEMSGTDLAYGATRRAIKTALHRQRVALLYGPTRFLRDLQY
eukprot:586232-Rhodomonas_salina.3